MFSQCVLLNKVNYRATLQMLDKASTNDDWAMLKLGERNSQSIFSPYWTSKVSIKQQAKLVWMKVTKPEGLLNHFQIGIHFRLQ